ncbi:CG5762 [Drosophila busckii]|uniref:CG5762 n=2 Tax=Drosophila busckii TaxID=30019 RepID=A0A0M4F5S6_DROBS|nr:CG5762 [Drosophila busckii]
MLVGRAMELLSARISSAQTRHIAKRVAQVVTPRQMTLEETQRERLKSQNYEDSKRRSMWQAAIEKAEAEQKVIERLDEAHYSHKDVEDRDYECTWVDFPEIPQPKKLALPEESNHPVRRRHAEERPDTAKPWGAEAADFLRQWDNNQVMINRNKYSRGTDILPSPSKNSIDKCGQERQKQFFY